MADKDQGQDGGETNAQRKPDAGDPVVQHTLDSGSQAAVPGAERSDTRSQRKSDTGDAVVDHTVDSGSQAAVPNPDDAAANVKTGSGAESGVTSDVSSGSTSDIGTANTGTSNLSGVEDHATGGDLVRDESLGGDDDLLDNPSETRGERTARQGDRGDVGDTGEEGAV
jgi:hypothetical protein